MKKLIAFLQRHRNEDIAVGVTATVLILLFLISLFISPNKNFQIESIHTAEKPIASISKPMVKNIPTKKMNERQVRTPKAVLPNYQKVIVSSGESLSHIFDRLKISPQQLLAISKLKLVAPVIKRLQAGQELEFAIDEHHQLQTLIIPINADTDLKITYQDKQYTAEKIPHPFDISSKALSAVVQSSLYQAGDKAAIPQQVMAKFLSIFKWKIDFTRQAQKGDTLTVFYEELRDLKTNKIVPGEITSALYIHNGKKYYAFRFRDNRGRVGYYDENGKSLLKSFLRKPINVGRISSGFNMHRMHPVLHIVRPHTGTDFAAAYGTPIHATGDGKIIFRGFKGGYGRTIIIDHGNNITTLYGHMSKFNQKYKKGAYVKQGDVIGYIGTSGLASGPHVHYEYRIKHKYQNPLKVNLPMAKSIPSNEKASYEAFVAREIEKLDQHSIPAWHS